MSIFDTDAQFEVMCKRCDKQFGVTRNFGGGLRRDNKTINSGLHNPAICDCGSRSFELF